MAETAATGNAELGSGMEVLEGAQDTTPATANPDERDAAGSARVTADPAPASSSASAAEERARRRAALVAAAEAAEALEEERESQRKSAAAAAATACGIPSDLGRSWMQAAKDGHVAALAKMLAGDPNLLHYQARTRWLKRCGFRDKMIMK